MRILMVVNTLPPRDVSGVGEQVLQLTDGLRAAGHEVEVLSRGAGGARGPKLLFPVTILPAAWRRIRSFRPDAVEIHESDGAGVALLVRAMGRRRPRLVALLQVSYRRERRAVRTLRWDGRSQAVPGGQERRFRRFKAPVQILLGRWSARAADLVLAPSQATAAEIAADYGVRNVAVVPNAIASTTHPVRAGAGGYFLFVGRLRIRKGVDVALAACARSQVPEGAWTLLLAGDGEHRGSLESKVAALGLDGRVRFLGRCERGRVRELLVGARALVVPSLYEGMPLVVLEAMEEGVPVVASRVSGIPEVVVDGETGWLVSPEDPAALARALDEAWRNPREAQRRGEAGRRRLERQFRPRRAAGLWEQRVAPLCAATDEGGK